MGLFKKRSDDPDELARLRSEIAAMGARLEAARAAESELGGKVDELTARLDAPEPVRDEAPAPATVSQADHDRLAARVQRLAEQLDAAIEAGEEAAQDADAEIEQLARLRARLDELTARFDLPTPEPPPPPATPGPDDTPIDLERVESRIDDLVARIDEVDARITKISAELANQIAELSDDLESRTPAEPVGELVDELRDAQVRLANEQARYQIAFRQDLSDLAERLKRA